MEPLRFESDTRHIGALFVVVGLALFGISFADAELPHWIGPLFAVIGALFGSSKTTSLFDMEAAEIRQSRLRLFFVKSEVVVGFDSVVRAGADFSSEKAAQSVSLLLDDGSILGLGSFSPEEAREHVQAISKALELDKRAGSEVGSVPQAEWKGVTSKRMGDSTVLVFEGVEGSFLPAAALFVLAPMVFFAGLRVVPDLALPLSIGGLAILGAAATLWRRSRPVVLEVNPKNGLSLAWPSLFGPERTVVPWSEIARFSTRRVRLNRRFLACPVVAVHGRNRTISFGDGLSSEECLSLVRFLESVGGESVGSHAATPSRKGIWALIKDGANPGGRGPGLVRTLKWMSAATLVGGVLLAFGYPSYSRSEGLQVFTPAQVREHGGGSLMNAGKLPGVQQVVFRTDSGDYRARMTLVTPYGFLETVSQSSEGGYYHVYFYLGSLVAIALGIGGFLMGFVGQCLQEQRMLGIGISLFLSLFPLALIGNLVFLIMVLAGL